MSHHLVEGKINSARHIRGIVEKVGKVQGENELNEKNGWNQQVMEQFFNILKHRIVDQADISELYCEIITEMNSKGLVVRSKGLRTIIPTVINKLRDGQVHINKLFENLVETHPTYLFSLMVNEVSKEARIPILEFIISHNEEFIKYAEIRHFIAPFLSIVCGSSEPIEIRDRVERLLDQIVELQGEKVLEEEAKKVKSMDTQGYLAKYNLVKKCSSTSFSINSKLERVKRDEDNPWTINVTPMDILKFIDELMSLREPFTILASPMLIDDEMKRTLNTQFTSSMRK